MVKLGFKELMELYEAQAVIQDWLEHCKHNPVGLEYWLEKKPTFRGIPVVYDETLGGERPREKDQPPEGDT